MDADAVLGRLPWCGLLLACLAVAPAPASAGSPQADPDRVTAVILRDMRPSCFIDPKTGRPSGFGVEVFSAIARQLGLDVTYVGVGDWEEVEVMLREGTADLCPVLSATDERETFVDFTASVETFEITISVRSRSRNIRGLSDLVGHDVAVLRASQASGLLKPHEGVRAIEYDSFQKAIFDLLAGHVDAFVAPSYIVLALVREAGIGDQITILSPGLKEVRRAIGVRKERRALYERINQAVPVFVGSPAYRQLYVKWFGSPAPFWTPTRVGVAMGSLLLLAVLGMALWRHVALLRMNRRLRESITERELVERELKRSEERLRLALDSANDGMYDWDIAGNSLYWSPRFYSMLGYEPGDFPADYDHLRETLHPDDREIPGKVIEQCNKGRDAFACELRMRARGGEWRTILSRGRVITRGADGRVARLVGTHTDITERKLNEEALRESEEKFSRIFHSSTNAIAFTEHPSGRVVDVNETWLRASGLSREQIIGRTALELGIWADLADREACFARLAEKGLVTDFETMLILRGSRVPFRMSAEYLDLRGRRYILWEFRDVSDQKRAEQEQERLRAQLLQAQKMEVVGRLAGGIAHDFNNLLTVINGYSAQVLEDLPPDHAHRLSLSEIRRAGDRAALLTHQLLAFSRRQVLRPHVLDLNSLLSETEHMLRRIIGEDIELVTAFDPGLGRVKVDPGQINQVLLNLVVNARDAMPDGGRLTLETANVEVGGDHAAAQEGLVPGPYVLLIVRDSGVGMDLETQAHLFEPFFTTKRVGAGTGLGLCTVYGIIQQSGGHISVESEPAKGATFKIYFPRIETAPEPQGETTQPPAPLPGAETILIVEDQEVVRRLTATVLQGLGYRVLDASSGEEAIAVVESREEPIDLLLTDVVMPGMSGRTLGQQARTRRPGIKVLYMSGYTDDVIMHHGVTESGVAFLQKPFTPHGLAEKVREVLSRPT